jgi:choline dehydrogenase-like flavoprotein
LNSRPEICVIGSGPGGAFAAVALARAGFSVLVIEAGTNVPHSDRSDFIDRLNIMGGAKPNFGFSRQLGGSSNLWAGRVAPLEPIDMEKRPWVPDSGWPFSTEALWPHYRAALEIMGLPSEIAATTGAIPPSWAVLTGGSVDIKRFYWSTPPFNTGTYLEQAQNELGNRLSVQTGVRAISLELVPSGTNIAALKAVSPDGPVRIEADRFVVAIGGIETPRLLLNSGIGNAYDNVGRYLSTHPKADIGLLLLNQKTEIGYSAFTDMDATDGRVRSGLGLSAKAQERLGVLNHYVQLTPLFEFQANRAFELIKGSAAVNSPLLNRNAAVRGFLPGLGSIAYELIGRLGGLQRRAGTFVLRGFLDQNPSRDNRVSLSGELDDSGIRKADVDWSFTSADRRSVLQFLEELDDNFNRSGIGRIDFKPLQETSDWPITGIHSHFMGTTRLGDDPATSVVDRNGLIHGLQNCYVSGPSTFPTYGYANPFLTIAALSLRLADHISERASLALSGS